MRIKRGESVAKRLSFIPIFGVHMFERLKRPSVGPLAVIASMSDLKSAQK